MNFTPEICPCLAKRMGDLFRALGNDTQARSYYEKALEVRERLVASAPENADYARDLWVSCGKMAELSEAESNPQTGWQWWQRAYDVLAAMKQRGWHISPEDSAFLEQLKEKLG